MRIAIKQRIVPVFLRVPTFVPCPVKLGRKESSAVCLVQGTNSAGLSKRKSKRTACLGTSEIEANLM